MVWLVMTEEGVGNVVTYEFAFERPARDFFYSRWVARILVDPQNTEVFAKSGLNPFALRSIRKFCVKKSKQSGSTWLQEVVVTTSLSGKELQLQLPAHTTVSDIKSKVEASWGVACYNQKMIVGSRVANDSDTVSALGAAEGTIPLHITMIVTMLTFEPNHFQCKYDELVQALESARSGPACVDAEAYENVMRLEAEVANFENGCHHQGVDLKAVNFTRQCPVYFIGNDD